ncbi:MAG: DUF6463 family protein, partial [Bacteroidota bacterium]
TQKGYTMKIWIGKVVVLIGCIHTLFGFVMLWPIFQNLLAAGLINTVNGQLDREAFFWFIHFGVALILLGALIDWVEKQGNAWPSWLAWSLLIWTIVLVAVMPVSGAWLMLIPAIGALRRQKQMTSARN